MKRKFLGELLVEVGMITNEQLDECLKIQVTSKERLGKILKSKGYVTDQQLMEIMEFQLGVPIVNLDSVNLSSALSQYIPESLAKKHSFAPIKASEGKLYLAMNDPLDFIAIDDAKMVSGLDVFPMIAPEQSIDDAITKIYGNVYAKDALKDLAEESSLEEAALGLTQHNANISNAPIVRLVNSIFEQAVKAKASDIHIEPAEKEVGVRMRIDGQLIPVLKIPKNAQSAVLTRIKIVGNMDIAEKRIPQDGRYGLIVSGNEIDVRISSLPTVHGEKIVMRLLDKNNFMISKEKLGFSKDNIEKFELLLKNPHGVILVTGPTGSGKSTTLYAMLGSLNARTENIITVEDPVEYTMAGINQVQVNVKAGLDFSNGLRSILRQDPDIIMVGEIRDQETVDIAIRAAITGHLVLSTIHTNDAPSTITRLIDMGIPSYMLAAALVGVLSQRLVKKICPSCKEEYKPSKFDLKAAGLPAGFKDTIYEGKGCSNCNNSGYKGRRAVHEILVIDREIREMMSRNESVDVIREYAIESQKMRTIGDECIDLMKKGITSIKEVIATAYSYQGGE
ncbi:MAG: type II/IV secretion system protein [Clostridia bacterium]|nr:type II/IV secretion system protein [Clostridia bacterium]MBT7122595.1 type II/IV secretion system protein [Clostridia bacterium]